MLSDGIFLIFISEIVTDLMPDPNFLKSVNCALCSFILFNLLEIWVRILLNSLVGLFNLLTSDFFKEFAHDKSIDEFVVTVSADLLPVPKVVIETVCIGQVFVEDGFYF